MTMLYQRLMELADRLRAKGKLEESLMLETPVKWELELDLQGKPQGITRLSGGGGPKKDRGLPMQVPSLGGLRTSGVLPYLLADKAEYVLGVWQEDESRAKKRNDAFVKLVKECAQETQLPEVQAVVDFYTHYRADLSIPPDLKESDYIVISVAGKRLIDLPAVRQFWLKNAPDVMDLVDSNRKVACLVCGRYEPPIRRHLIKLKGVPGGQTGGVSLSSANAPAFYSYALEEGFVSPICFECSEYANKALNYLLDENEHHLSVRNLVYAFWTLYETEFDFFSFLSQPRPETVEELFSSPITAKQVKLQENEFYAVALSASGARAVVRSFIETTVPRVQQNLQRWFKCQQLIDWRTGKVGEPLGIYALSACLYRDAQKELRPEVPKLLIECALTGSCLPDWILYRAVERNRAEQGITYPRAVLIKLVLCTQKDCKQNQMEVTLMLDKQNQDPAYRCGRLLAILETIQKRAVDPKATLVDRYYGSASTAPASVFGTLLRTAQSHLSKLRKENEPAYINLSRELEEAMPNQFPTALSLHQQALFALGYYHQRAQIKQRKAQHQQKTKSEEDNNDEN